MIRSLRKETIQIGCSSETKEDLLKEIARLAKKSPLLKSLTEEDIVKALKKREELSSTGLSQGIAIPHCSFDSIKDFVTGLLILKEGIDFNSMDGEKTRFIFFIVGPTDAQNEHINILTSITKLSRDLPVLEQLLSAADSEDVVAVLVEKEDETYNRITEKSQFVLHIQDENIFNEALETLTSESQGTLSVIEAMTAGSYLHKLPLFSSFFREAPTSFSKIIVAVVDRALVNDTIRRLNMLKNEEGQGLLITVHDLSYCDGALNY